MNKSKNKTRNPKKLRREAKSRRNRELTLEQATNLFNAAVQAGAPMMAEKILNIRGGITVAEAEALVALVNLEAAANNSMTRVVVEVKSEE